MNDLNPELVENVEAGETVHHDPKELQKSPEEHQAQYERERAERKRALAERLADTVNDPDWRPDPEKQAHRERVRDEYFRNLPEVIPQEAVQLPTLSAAFLVKKQLLADNMMNNKLAELRDKAEPDAKDLIDIITAAQLMFSGMQRQILSRVLKNEFEKEDTPFEDWLMNRYSMFEAATPFEVIQHIEEKSDLQSQRMREMDSLEMLLDTYRTNDKRAQEELRNLQTETARLKKENRELRQQLGIYGGEQDDNVVES